MAANRPIVRGIELTVSNYRCFDDAHPLRFTIQDGFTAIVGVNNSGKSAALRFFFEFAPLFNQLAASRSALQNAVGNAISLDLQTPFGTWEEVFSNQNNRPLTIALKPLLDEPLQEHPPHVEELGLLMTLPRDIPTLKGELQFPDGRKARTDEGYGIADDYLVRMSDRTKVGYLPSIPEAASFLANPFYVPAYRSALGTAGGGHVFNFHTGSAAAQRWGNMRSGGSKAAAEITEKISRSLGEVFGFKHLTIDLLSGGTSFQIFVDGKPYRLDEVGSGVGQFLSVLVNAAAINPGFVLIDEPEAHLHPALQLEFLTLLAGYARHGVLFATHSLGLARLIAQRIYSTHRRSPGVCKVLPFERTPDLPEFLGSLSYAGYQELGADTLLLVEGPHDVPAFRHFLHLQGKEHRVVVMPLGGESMINSDRSEQLVELKRIAGKVAAVIDSEKPDATALLSGRRADFVSAAKAAGIRTHVTERRATENYLTSAAVRQEKGAQATSLSPFERLNPARHGFSKANIFRIAQRMELKDIEGTDLNTFLATL